MPVTRIVPARPMTNAPHQLVPLTRPFSDAISMLAIAPPHSASPPTGADGRPEFLEERQVTLYLPAAHDGVPVAELLALDRCVVVYVVPVRRLSQRLA